MNDNESIKSAIRRIVSAGNVDSVDFLDCFVTKVYQEDEEQYGTIDVKTLSGGMLINGVLLSAIEDNTRGEIKLPTLLSEVTVAVVNGDMGYVVEYSHIDSHIIDANKKVSVGVTGVEDVTEEQDYDEAEVDGLASATTYTSQEISSLVVNDKSEISGSSALSASQFDTVINNVNERKTTKIHQNANTVQLSSGVSTVDVGSASVAVQAPSITLSNGGATQNAVLGNALQTVLNAFIDQVATITTSTAIGTQPILNAAAVLSLKSQVNSIISSVNFIE